MQVVTPDLAKQMRVEAERLEDERSRLLRAADILDPPRRPHALELATAQPRRRRGRPPGTKKAAAVSTPDAA